MSGGLQGLFDSFTVFALSVGFLFCGLMMSDVAKLSLGMKLGLSSK